jgi:hypothetical protein
MYFVDNRKAKQLCKVFNAALPTEDNPIIRIFLKHRLVWLTPKLRKEYGMDTSDGINSVSHIKYGLYCGEEFGRFFSNKNSIKPYNWVMWALLEDMGIELGPGESVTLGMGIRFSRHDKCIEKIYYHPEDGDDLAHEAFYTIRTDGRLSASKLLDHYYDQLCTKYGSTQQLYNYTIKGM